MIAVRKTQTLLTVVGLMLFCSIPLYAARAVITTSPKSPIRSGPSKEFMRMTVLPSGVKLWAIGREGSWYKVTLCQALDGWIGASNIRELDAGVTLDTARLTDMSVSAQDDVTRVLFYLTDRVPFRIRQSVFPAQLKVDLFRCAAAQEAIHQFPGTVAVRPLPPQQLASDWAEITLDLTNAHQTGYRAYFSSSGHLIVDIKGPFASASVAGKRVAIDPGHGGPDSGAVGPTGLCEKDANLAISMALRQELLSAGAEVFMTRERDVAVGPGGSRGAELEARVAASKAAKADLFISVHNNAVGSGNAAKAYGTETYYWTPMSYLPAVTIQEAVVAALGTRDRFVGWQRFYVMRETDCPRVLVECAFVSNPQEEQKLRAPLFLHQASRGIFEGIRAYFAAAVQPPSVTPAVPQIELLPTPLVGPKG